MKKFFTIYSLTDCSYCKKAIDLLDKKKLRFVVVAMDKNPEFVDKVKEDMRMKTVPIVIEHLDAGQIKIVGGFDDLENYVNLPEFSHD